MNYRASLQEQQNKSDRNDTEKTIKELMGDGEKKLLFMEMMKML